MTQDDVIRITRALGICELTSKPKKDIHYSLTIQEMLKVLEYVETEVDCGYSDTLTIAHMDGYERGRDAGINQEREACANLCQSMHKEWVKDELGDIGIAEPSDCAKAIRARGEA